MWLAICLLSLFPAWCAPQRGRTAERWSAARMQERSSSCASPRPPRGRSCAVATARELGDGPLLIDALKSLAQVERDLGRRDAALPLYKEAVALCRAAGDDLLLAHTVRHLSDLHQDAGHLDAAGPYYVEAVALYRAAGERAGALDVANAIRPLALLKDAQGRPDEAVPLWREARALYAAIDLTAGVAECDARLATSKPGGGT